MSSTERMTLRKTAAIRDRRYSASQPPPAASRASMDDAILAVQSEWNGWRTAMVRVSQLENVHWAQPAGAPRPLIHAFVHCDRLHSGQITHPCDRTPPPHRLLVCILKSHAQARVFQELARRAGDHGVPVPPPYPAPVIGGDSRVPDGIRRPSGGRDGSAGQRGASASTAVTRRSEIPSTP
jgi:hypothetical protein